MARWGILLNQSNYCQPLKYPSDIPWDYTKRSEREREREREREHQIIPMSKHLNLIEVVTV